MTEIWREVPNTAGTYEVSDLGRVRSWRNRHGGRLSAPKIINQPTVMGYKVYGDSSSRPRRLRKTHRAVCAAFHGPPPAGKPIVRHLDGDRTNNTPANLRWGDHAENSADAVLHGVVPTGEGHPRAKLTQAGVAEIRRRYAAGGESYRTLGREFGVDKSIIGDIVNGRTWRLPPAKRLWGDKVPRQPSA